MNTRTLAIGSLFAFVSDGCDRSGAGRMDASIDQPSVIIADRPTPPRDVPGDVPSYPPVDPELADGSVRLHARVEPDRPWPNTRCPGARFVGPHAISEERRMCRIGDTFVMPGTGLTAFFNTRTNTATTIGLYSARESIASVAYCAGSKIVTSVDTRPPQRAWTGIALFDDITSIGRVLWTQPLPPTFAEAGTARLVATDRVMAWLWQGADYRTSVWVGRPDGTHIRQIRRDEGAEPIGTYFHADGGRVVWMNGYLQIMMYDTDTDQVTALADNPAEHWQPWIQGDRVVWMERPANSNLADIILYDLRTRTRRKITNNPPNAPVLETDPILYNDWVIWSDLRHALNPNPRSPQAERLDLYGYNLQTQREYHLFGGPGTQAVYPVVFDNEVYFSCRDDYQANPLGFAVPLPDPTQPSDAAVPPTDASATDAH